MTYQTALTAGSITGSPADTSRIAAAPGSELLTPKEAAAYLNVPLRNLERWRGTGEGPRYIRMSRKTIRYPRTELDIFVEERLRRSTTRGAGTKPGTTSI